MVAAISRRPRRRGRPARGGRLYRGPGGGARRRNPAEGVAMGGLTPTEMARQMADVFEPMLLQVRREFQERQDKFRQSLAELISSMVRAEIAETLARLGAGRQMAPAH